jgi:hypothetical protein
MKRVLTTALVLSLSMAVLTSPVLADNQEKDESRPIVFTERIQAPESQTMEAVIKEIHDHEWIVADQDGKEYTVPILGFEQLEDYKNLNPTVGTEVTLKGNSIDLAAGPVKFFHTVDAVKEDGDMELASENVKVFKLGSKDGVIEVNKEEILKTMKGKGAGAIKVVKGILSEEGTNLTEKDFTELSENVKVFKRSEDGVIEVSKGEILKTMMDKEAGMIKAVKGTPGEEGANLTKIGVFKELKGDLFMAHEMTVDGMTLKLPNMRITVPALPATEKANE